jgi:predicted deacylase
MPTDTQVIAPATGDHDELVLVRWLVGPGDTVDTGQTLAILAVDKGDRRTVRDRASGTTTGDDRRPDPSGRGADATVQGTLAPRRTDPPVGS